MHMTQRKWAVLFLGKEKDGRVEQAAEFCRRHFTNVCVRLGKWGDPFPADALSSRWDCIISYLSRWIVTEAALASAEVAINFHPGPPEYPGYGCNNFAIYEDAREYGVTCHHMAPRVDTGAIIEVVRFPVLASDNAGTLLVKAYDVQLALFYRIAGLVARGEALPASREAWTRKPFTRAQFSELGRLTPDMTEQEIARRKRALDVGALKL